MVAKNIQHHLQFIGHLLSRKANYSFRINKRFEIKTALENYCADYKNDPKKMINSVINYHQPYIIINKLLIKEDNIESVELITNPDRIKIKVNKHFQQ